MIDRARLSGSTADQNSNRHPWMSAAKLVAYTCLMAAVVVASADPAFARRGGKVKQVVKPKDPLMIMISLGKQRLTVFDGAKAIASSRISSGRAGYRTPTGVFSILQKRRRHYSNIYRGAAMPNMQRLTWSGIAMHAGHVPGYPASHGCIRLPYGFSKKLFSLTRMNGRVIVTRGQPKPVPISHANLLKPLPPGDADAAETARSGLTTGSTGQSSEAGMRLGVETAKVTQTRTDEGLSSGQRTRASVAAARVRLIEQLTSDLETLKTSHEEASAKLKVANVGLIEAAKTLRLTKIDARKQHKKLSTANAMIEAAERRIRDFLLRHHVSDAAEDTDKLRETEEAFESELLNRIQDANLIREDLAVLQASIAKQEKAMDEGKAKRDVLKKAFTESSKTLRQTQRKLAEAEKAEKNADKPITVVISRKTKTLRVRQGWDPLMEAPIEIERPDAPLGTQVYFAHSYTEDSTDLRWYAVTADTNGIESKKKKRKRYRNSKRNRAIKVAAKADEKITPPRPMPAQTPQNGLARITIPDVIAEKLAEHIKPGSAMIITDEGRSPEIGEYTDLIVTYR